MRTRCAHDPGLVGIGSKARIGARDIVGDNRIATLAGKLSLCVLKDVISLCRKSDHAPLSLLARKLSQDIDRLDQFDAIQAFVGLFELMIGRGCGRVVSDGSRTNGRIGRPKGSQSRLQHFSGGLHAHTLHAAGNIERCRAQHKRDRSSAASGLPRQGDAHLAR